MDALGGSIHKMRHFVLAFHVATPVLVDDARVNGHGGGGTLPLDCAQISDRHFQDVSFFELRMACALLRREECLQMR